MRWGGIKLKTVIKSTPDVSKDVFESRKVGLSGIMHVETYFWITYEISGLVNVKY